MMMMMMMTETVLETWISYRYLTQLIAQKDCIDFSRSESSRSYVTSNSVVKESFRVST